MFKLLLRATRGVYCVWSYLWWCSLFRIMDHDTYTAHDAIGKVYIPLSSLASADTPLTSMSGWYPIFDTLHGIRGSVHVVIKVEVLKAQHLSSLAVQFFTCKPATPT